MEIKELTVKDIKNIMMDKALIIVLVFMIIGIIIIEPSFLQIRVLADILAQSVVKMIYALGLMFALFLGGTDLSDGRQIGLAAVMVASLSQMANYSNKLWSGLPELPVVIPVVVTLALVAVIGTVNGFMIAKLKVAPFITTFGMSIIVYDINCLYFVKKSNNSQPIGGIRDALTVLSGFEVFDQVFFLVVIAITAIMGIWFLLNKAMFRKNICTVGSNPGAAKISGINVGKVIITVFIIESILVGLVDALEMTRTKGADSTYGDAYGSDAMSPCVVGDVSLSEGAEKVPGIIVGILIFTFVNYGLVYIGINSNQQPIVKGLIICSAMALDMRKNP